MSKQHRFSTHAARSHDAPDPNPIPTSAPASTRRRPLALGLIALLALVAALLVPVASAAGAQAGATVIYDDEIRVALGDWSWATVDLDNSENVAEGTSAIKVDYEGWDALYLGTTESIAAPEFGSLDFAMHGGTSGGEVIVALLTPAGEAASTFVVDPPAGRWQRFSIDLATFGNMAQIGGIWWQDNTGIDRTPIWVDDISFQTSAPPPPVPGPDLTVDLGPATISRTVTDPASGVTRTNVVTFPHDISEGIYGANFSTDAFREEVDVTVNRWGGNSIERYNHTIGATNLGNDWYFANSADAIGEDDQFEADNQADGTATIMTVPMLGWVAKNREGTCSYPVTDVFGAANNASPMDSTINHWLDDSVVCGNGYRGGEFIGSADPTITSMATDASWATGLVNAMTAEHGTAAAGGVEMYALGNEPGLWHATHGDVRPDPIGRDEIVERNVAWASAIKDADPSADVIGPVLWSGYSYYAASDEVLAGQRPGDVPTFVPDYLRSMASAEADAGRRLLDTLAVNFYDDRVYGGGSDELRLEATRSLWDPTYAPGDWWVIRDFTGGEGHAVIPRLQSAIDANYPGTDLAITEYSFGGQDTIAGALAQTDALGIFGREDLDIATIWEPYAEWTGLTEQEWADRPIMSAFRMYRNYDGSGSRFGNEALHSTSADESAVSVFGARRQSDGRITVMIVNKANVGQVSDLRINGIAGPTEVYRYSGADLGAINREANITFDTETELTLPRRSATLLVIDPSDAGPVEPPPSADECLGEPVTVDIGAGQAPTAGDDVILGTPGDDVIAGGAGDDIICGLGGDDRIWGQAGSDLLSGGGGDDRLRGGSGNDALYGDEGSDDLNGGSGDDQVYGGLGADTAVRGGTGDDLVDGGAGDDLIVNGNGGSDVVNGGAGNDALVAGGPRPDVVSGGPGDDRVKGHKGADELFGNDGADELIGGAQRDMLDGGPGVDICNGSTTAGEAIEGDSATACESVTNVP